MTADRPEVSQYGILLTNVIGTEPGLVSGSAARQMINVIVGVTGVSLGAGGGTLEE